MRPAPARPRGGWRRPSRDGEAAAGWGPPGAVEVRAEVRPPWPYALPRAVGMDGLMRRRGAALERLLHVGGEPVVVRAAQPAADRVVLGARAADRAAAAEALARVRFALAVDDDLRPFHARFRCDPLIGVAVRAHPRLRILRRPPFEALTFAVCEQLIDYETAAGIQRRLIARFGARAHGLRDAPSASALAAAAPAELEACGLTPTRAIALRRAAREVAAGRVDLAAADHERGWTRLRRIRGIGAWTVECLAINGQGRYDQLPAGDLAYRKLVARLRTGGDPAARAEEDEVRAFFAPYGEWAGLAGAYALRAAAVPSRAAA